MSRTQTAAGRLGEEPLLDGGQRLHELVLRRAGGNLQLQFRE